MTMATATLQKTMTATNTFRCLECGKCTATCPVARYNGTFSPRRIVGRLITADPANVPLDPTIWNCLSCGLCGLRCPSDVKYGALTKALRAEAVRLNNNPFESHGGALQSTMRIMATSDQPQDRMGWVTDDLEITEKGEYGYFVGCIPYYDAYFEDLKPGTASIAQGSVRVMNHLGIEPAVLKDERCCGHDLVWGGDVENFKRLAERNVQMIRDAGITKLVTHCPECYHTINKLYPSVVGPLGFEMIYITELISEHLGELKDLLAPIKKTVSFQDPCRLGRHSGIYDSPREVISLIPGMEFHEMTKYGKGAICCGTSAWQNCDQTSKKIQTDRLVGAHDVGAEMMITACPKCLIHFKCTLQGDSIPDDKKVEVRDLISLLGEALNGK